MKSLKLRNSDVSRMSLQHAKTSVHFEKPARPTPAEEAEALKSAMDFRAGFMKAVKLMQKTTDKKPVKI